MKPMDLGSPLSSLGPTLDSVALEVLSRTESGLSASRVAQLSRRGSRQGLTLALDRLTDQGLVLAESANRGYLYRLNRDHVLIDAVLAAVRSRSTILARLAAAVERLTPEPLSAAVFGSLARQEGGPESDVDLVLVLPKGHDPHETTWRSALQDLEQQVLGWTGNRLETLVFDEDTLLQAAEAGEAIVRSLLEESVTLRGRSLAELVRSGEPVPPT